MFACGQLDFELFDEGGHVAVGDHGAFVLLDAEDGGRNGNLHVLLDFHLASQPPVVLDLFAGEESHFGGQNAAAAFEDTAFALSAGTFAAAGRGEVYLLLGEGGDERVAGGDFQFLVVVDGDGHVAGRQQFGAQQQEQRHQNEDDHQKDDQCGDYSCCHFNYSLMPIKLMNAKPMRPVMMKVMPTPLSAGGMWL